MKQTRMPITAPNKEQREQKRINQTKAKSARKSRPPPWTAILTPSANTRYQTDHTTDEAVSKSPLLADVDGLRLSQICRLMIDVWLRMTPDVLARYVPLLEGVPANESVQTAATKRDSFVNNSLVNHEIQHGPRIAVRGP